MATKTLSISEDAYLHLRSLKAPGESFSDVIGRLAGRTDVMRYAGSVSAELATELGKASLDVRRRLEQDRRDR